MTSVSLGDLSEKWQTQQEKARKRDEGLLKAAYDFKGLMVKKLDAEGKSYRDLDTGEAIPYVGFDIEKKSNGHSILLPQTINNYGAFVFSIRVVVDKGENTYPKSAYTLPVAIKYENQNLKYCWWDSEKEDVSDGTNWFGNPDDLANLLIDRLVEYLEYDPLNGLPAQRSIGFTPG